MGIQRTAAAKQRRFRSSEASYAPKKIQRNRQQQLSGRTGSNTAIDQCGAFARVEIPKYITLVPLRKSSQVCCTYGPIHSPDS